MTFLLHCGGKPASFEDICEVELPEATDTYRPVPNGDLVRLMEEEIKVRTGLTKPERSFGLSAGGQQLFGYLRYKLADVDDRVDLTAFGRNLGASRQNMLTKYGFTIGLRNSYDKSMSVGFCGGASCFVCDNLCFHGSLFTYLHPHTKNVWDKIVPTVMTQIAPMVAGFEKVITFQESMKGFKVDLDRGYEVLGLARGRGVLTTVQHSAALKEWRETQKQEHHFHSDHDNAYGLYQTFTQALKLGHVGRKIDAYTGASHLFEELDLVEDVDFEEVA